MRALILIIWLSASARAIALPADQSDQSKVTQALREHPDSATAHLAYAEMLSANGNLRAAIVHWQTAQSIDPANAAAANSLGGAYLRLGLPVESAGWLACDRRGLDRWLTGQPAARRTVLLRTATSPMPSRSGSTILISTPGSGLPTVSGRKGLKSLSVTAVPASVRP